MKINSIRPDYHNYLKIVYTIATPPKRLWYVGSLPSQRHPTVAIIGTRAPTPYGREIANLFSTSLAEHGVIVVSGLALGIDAVAHRAAVTAKGVTLAIMAGGLDAVHPTSHYQLARDIVSHGGALISEYAAGDTPYPGNFIARNRIVAGLSDAIVVIEAGTKSGTMHTAAFALEQGRSVMAVPGNITNPLSEGCNNLIKAGARAVTSAADIFDELGMKAAHEKQPELPLAASKEEQIIIRLMTHGERDGEALQKQSGLSPALFGQTLTMLEVSGKVRALGANQWGF